MKIIRVYFFSLFDFSSLNLRIVKWNEILFYFIVSIQIIKYRFYFTIIYFTILYFNSLYFIYYF